MNPFARFVPFLLPTALAAQTPNLAPAEFLPGTPVISPTAGTQRRPALAAGATSSLLVFEDDRAGDFDLYGLRLGPDGAPLDALPFSIYRGPGDQTRPAVSWNGSSWLVVFSNQVDPGSGYFATEVAALRVGASGAVLDAVPIGLMLDSSGATHAVTSDGSNWAVVFTGYSGGNEGIAVRRVSAGGLVLDPAPVLLRPGTGSLTTDLQVGFVGGNYVFGWNDSGLLVQRFTPALVPLDASPRTLTSEAGLLVSSPGQLLVVRSAQTPIFTSEIVVQRFDAGLAALDATPVSLSGSQAATYHVDPRATFDGTRWIVGWTHFGSQLARAARFSTGGVVLDPLGVALPEENPSVLYDHALGALPGGGALFAWDDIRNTSTLDVFGTPLSAGGVAGAERCYSLGAENQEDPRLAAAGDFHLVAFRALSGTGSRILVQRVDRFGRALDPEPLEAARAGNALLTMGGVAWNGEHFLVVWSNAAAGLVLARRFGADGVWLDSVPFLVMSGTAPDVAALGADFLVSALHAPSYPQFIYSFAVRVASDGTVLDSTPLLVGESYATRARIAVVGDRWMVATESHWSHNQSMSTVLARFVDAAGGLSTQISLGLYNVQVRGSLDVASSGTSAFVVCPSGSNWTNTEVQGALIEADETVLFTNQVLTGYAGMGQFRPTVTHSGRHYLVAFESYENNAWFYDFEPDVYGLRFLEDGTPVDARGFALWDGEDRERSVDVASLGQGKGLFACSAYDEGAHRSMRIALRGLRPDGLANYGTGTAGCDGLQRMDADREPRLGSPGFTLLSDRAPAGGTGLFVLGAVPDLAGSDPFGLGVLFHVDPTPPNLVRLFAATADADGRAQRVLPIPPLPALLGRTFYFQSAFAWSSPCVPSSSGFSTSDGLAVTIRP